MNRFLALVFAVGLLLAPGLVSAECTNPSGNLITWYCDDQGEAYAKAHTLPPKHPGSNPGPIIVELAPTGDTYNAKHFYPGPQSYSSAGSASWTGGDCSTRSTETGWFTDDDPNTSNDVCNNGCYMAASLNLDTQQTEWYPTGDVCTDADVPPPQQDSDGDGVPDEEDAFPNDPDESADSDGDGTGDNQDAQPEDEEDGADDGEGDETDNEASGGGTCDGPPTCTGDGIACNTLIQQWRTRCAIEGHGQAIQNASCDSTLELKCTGLTLQQCYDLAYQKKQACAAGGEGVGDEQPEWTKVQGDGSEVGGEDPDPESVVHEGIGLNPENFLDDGGFWGSSSCPTLGTIQLPLYGSFSLDQFDFLCDLLAAIRALLLLLGAFIALRILMGG